MLSGIAELRNILSHEYPDIKWEKIVEFIKNASTLYPPFIEKAKEFIKLFNYTEIKKQKMKRENLITVLKETLEKEKDILFAYLYGSYALNVIHPKSDIDVAVYFKPSDIKDYIQKEKKLSITLITKLHNDNIDLRILNTLPFLLKYKVIKEGIPILIKGEPERIDFETTVMNRFFELKPYLDEYNQMLLQRIKTGI